MDRRILFLFSIMTFVSNEDCDVHDTFERAAVIRLPLEVNRSLNYAVAAVVLVHNLGFEYPVDPYRCRNIHDLAKAVKPTRTHRKLNIDGFLVDINHLFIITYFAIMSRATRPLTIAIAMIGIRFHLSRMIYFVYI